LKNKWIPTRLISQSERRALPTRRAVPDGGGGVFLSFLQVVRFLALLAGLRFRRIPEQQKAVIVREFLERRGGLWVKIAQTLASRHDAMPAVYCEELGKLFDSAAAFPGDQARQVVEESLGRPLDDVFAEFSSEPIAAASIAQIHKARLRWNDVTVAVKVRRPYIETIFRRDLKLVRILANLLECIPSLRHIHPSDMYDELELMLLEELDFRVEATLIRDMRDNLRRQGVFSPKVFFRYCTRDVLVMSFVEGVLMSDYVRILGEDPLRVAAWLDENHINPARLARRIYISCQRQVFEDNLFHGDLHPGNIMIMRNNRFALLDFGAVGSLDLNTRKQVMLYHRLVGEGDLSKSMMVLIHMSSPVPRIDLASLVRKLVRVTQKSLRYMTVKGLSYEERIYSDAANQQLRLLGQARIPVSWDFLRAQRTFTVLEMSLRQLDTKIQPMKLSHAYFTLRGRRMQAEAGGETRLLLNDIERFFHDAGFLLRDFSDSQALAGSIWGRNLQGREAQVVRFVFGVLLQSLGVAALLIVAVWGIQHQSRHMPAWIHSLLVPVAYTFPQLSQIAWLGLFLLTVGIYRVVSMMRRSYG